MIFRLISSIPPTDHQYNLSRFTSIVQIYIEICSSLSLSLCYTLLYSCVAVCVIKGTDYRFFSSLINRPWKSIFLFHTLVATSFYTHLLEKLLRLPIFIRKDLFMIIQNIFTRLLKVHYYWFKQNEKFCLIALPLVTAKLQNYPKLDDITSRSGFSATSNMKRRAFDPHLMIFQT